MAGAGYRTWTAGEVVTASNVQSYLQDQTVGVYAGTAARSSAILSPSEGQVSYRTDDDVVEVYDGSAWVPVSPPDTAGLKHIETQSPSGVSGFSFSNDVFTSTYDHYMILGSITGTGDAYVIGRVRAAGSDISTTTYTQTKLDVTVSGASGSRATGQSSVQLGYSEQPFDVFMRIYIMNPKLAKPTYINSDALRYPATPATQVTWGSNTNATAYDSFSILMGSGNMTGSFSLFGVKK